MIEIVKNRLKETVVFKGTNNRGEMVLISHNPLTKSWSAINQYQGQFFLSGSIWLDGLLMPEVEDGGNSKPNQISIDLVELIAPLLALTLSIGIGLWAKDALDALIKGLTFRADTAIEEGCTVYIDGDKATIIKIGIFKTTFQITNGRGVTWRYVPNKRIEFLKIEKS